MVSRITSIQRNSGDSSGLSTIQVVRLEKRFKRKSNPASGTVLRSDIVAILKDPSVGLGADVPREAIDALKGVCGA